MVRKKAADLRTSYVHDKAHIETNVSSDSSGPVLNGAIVLGHQGWLAGYQYVYSTAKSALTKNSFAFGYKGKDFTLFGNMSVIWSVKIVRWLLTSFSLSISRNDANEVGGSVYQRLNSRLETGAQIAWTSGTNQTRFALASKFQLDNQTALAAKVNNVGQIGLSFQQLLQPGKYLSMQRSNSLTIISRSEIDSISTIRSSQCQCRWTSSWSRFRNRCLNMSVSHTCSLPLFSFSLTLWWWWWWCLTKYSTV